MEHISNLISKTINLDINETVNLGTNPIRIRVTEGIAWITSEKEDVFIDVGQSIELKANDYPIVVSSARYNQPLVFTTEQIFDTNHANINDNQSKSKTLGFGLKRFSIAALNIINS